MRFEFRMVVWWFSKHIWCLLYACSLVQAILSGGIALKLLYWSILKDNIGSRVSFLHLLRNQLWRYPYKEPTGILLSIMHCFDHLTGAFAIEISMGQVEVMTVTLSIDIRLKRDWIRKRRRSQAGKLRLTAWPTKSRRSPHALGLRSKRRRRHFAPASLSLSPPQPPASSFNAHFRL